MVTFMYAMKKCFFCFRNAVKSGELYIEDPVDKEWTAHFFVLNHNKLFYTSHYKLDGDNSER